MYEAWKSTLPAYEKSQISEHTLIIFGLPQKPFIQPPHSQIWASPLYPSVVLPNLLLLCCPRFVAGVIAYKKHKMYFLNIY